jgi:thiol-disulfide isomerase/thioredoxin
MKKIFSPIIKLWRWIKETAWIQPLLIVGVVFAIVFSISPFVNWINGLNSTESETNAYYDRFKVSLEGILSASGEDKSAAGKFMQNLIGATSTSDTTKKNEYIASLPANKFFLSFVQKECTSCQEAKAGFETLEQKWNSGYYVPSVSGEQFKMVTIFCDESVTNDTNNSTLKGFGKFLDNYPQFFDTASANIQDTDYYIQGKVDKTKLGYFESADVQNFQTPTILLIDFTAEGRDGVSELLFNVPNEGDDSSAATAKARTLIDCWNHTGDFVIKNA